MTDFKRRRADDDRWRRRCRRAVTDPRVPGVVAMATDRHGNIYEGAAGKRAARPRRPDMTADTVFAIFSTTKAITGTAVLQLVEEGKLDLDAPAKTTRRTSAS